jgi:FtsH-binding integral membrane protein
MVGTDIILTLKVLVSGVTVLLVASLAALAAGRPRLHGRINTVFFILTMGTVAGFETLIHFVDVKSSFDSATRAALNVHLCFSIPSAVLLPAMFLTGIQRRKKLHRGLAVLFLALWIGTVVTGVFYLPHG